MTLLNADDTVSLVNSDGYELTSLDTVYGHRAENYTASYPANGEMKILYSSFDPASPGETVTVQLSVAWECENTPVVPPAEGFDSSEYLTLPEDGTYQRRYSTIGQASWIIPCTGMLSIAAQLGDFAPATVSYNNSQNEVVFSDHSPFTSSGNYSVVDYFFVTLSCVQTFDENNFFFLSWACESHSSTVPSLPTLPPTPAPPTQPPPTPLPAPVCSEPSSPLNTSFSRGPIRWIEKCWVFQCTGTVHITFVTLLNADDTVSLVNSDGYELTSLDTVYGHRAENYTASYPANGEMKILYSSFDPASPGETVTVQLSVAWECENTPVVPPAEGFDSSEYLTLPEDGTYQRRYSTIGQAFWIIPCTGMLSIAAQVGDFAPATVSYNNSQNEVVFSDHSPFTSSGNYSVVDYFFVTLSCVQTFDENNFFFLSWACESHSSTVPSLPTLPPTPAPPTQPPPTPLPAPVCSEPSSPLNTSFSRGPIRWIEKCWVFQCTGTVHITFVTLLNADDTVSLVNSDGYELTSLDTVYGQGRKNYTASYPANGEMKILYVSFDPASPGETVTVQLSVAWECENTPVVPPAEGFDPSEYLTLPEDGTYQRLYSTIGQAFWIIPCTGMLSIAAQVGDFAPATVSYNNSQNEVVFSDHSPFTSSGNYSVVDYFFVSLSCVQTFDENNFFFLSWTCEYIPPTPAPTPLPPTPLPPTPVPPVCLETSSPLDVLFTPASRAFMMCWTFQCTGTVHVSFSNMTASAMCGISLVNSNGYELMSITPTPATTYRSSYPANGEMMIVYNDSDWGGMEPVYFIAEWECEDTPVVPPAEGFDPSEYLTLPEDGTYQRHFSGMGPYNWIIPCTGELSIEAQLGGIFQSTVTLITDNETVFAQGSPFNVSWNCSGCYGYFVVELTGCCREREPLDNVFTLEWSGTNSSTASPTDLPTTLEPPTPAPDTALPTATPTDLPAGASFAPPTPAPDTALPTATPTDLPAGASFAPPTSAPDTALPTATPTDLPAGNTFAPPSPPAVNALCTTDKDCRSGRLDPKATCNAGTCVCHTQGYAHPPGVPLCLLAGDVTVPMGFAVEYGAGARSSWTTAITAERFEDTMGETLGTVTEIHVVVSDDGVLVVGMVRASTEKLADALSGKLNLTAALSSEGVTVSHGVTCTSTDASYTVQHNGVCNAVECEGSTTLTLADGTYTCVQKSASTATSSKVFVYVGIGVGLLVLAVCVVVVFCCLKQKQHPKEPEPLLTMPLDKADVYAAGKQEEEKTLLLN